MSIKTNIDTLNQAKRDKINNELKLELKGPGMSKWIFPFDLIGDDLFVPFAYGIRQLKLKRPLRDTFTVMNRKFQGILRDEQLIVKKEAIDILDKQGSVIISAYPGFGKTIGSISLACTMKLKTLIIVNKIVLINQWADSITTFCPSAKIQKLTTKSEFDNECDFFIMNAINVPKMGPNFFKNIGNCIVDELHLIMAEGLSKSLQNICPRYLIGLSATPYREDGLDGLISYFFGDDKIIRKLHRKHIVYKVETGLKIELELSESTGKVNWGAVLKEQSENQERNDLIVKIVEEFKDRTFLILCKRVEQANYFIKKLHEKGENVDSLVGSKQDFNRDCRILVGILSKVGTGFDWSKLNGLILACDLEAFFIQSLGRVFRTKDTIPIVFDIIDKNPILMKHYNSRVETYRECGGIIKSFNREFFDTL